MPGVPVHGRRAPRRQFQELGEKPPRLRDLFVVWRCLQPRPELRLPTRSANPRPPAPGQDYLGRTGGPGDDGGAGIAICCSALDPRVCACAFLPDIGARPSRLRPPA